VADAFNGQVQIASVPNPRVEKEEHYYRAAHTKLLDLGLVPHLLDRATLSSILGMVERYKDHIDLDTIAPSADWRSASATGSQKSESTAS
jgi:UDP-sulfoquinovose synthase